MNDSIGSVLLMSPQGQNDVDTIAAKGFSCKDLEGGLCLLQQIFKVGELGDFGKRTHIEQNRRLCEASTRFSIWWKTYLGITNLTFTRFFGLANKWPYKQLFGTELVINTHTHACMHARVHVHTHTHTHTEP